MVNHCGAGTVGDRPLGVRSLTITQIALRFDVVDHLRADSLCNRVLLGNAEMETVPPSLLHQTYSAPHADEFEEARLVLNEMAEMNKRPALPYGLEGENEKDTLAEYKKITYQDMLSNPLIRRITIPLAVLWIFREYIYYRSYIIIPELGTELFMQETKSQKI
jgi:hypothetical protein